jgi:hypothetical protein
VRRLSVASPDSGAESSVYGTAPTAPAGRDGAPARPSWATATHAPRNAADATRATMAAAAQTVPAQVGTGASRLATTYDMSVVDRQSGRWYVKDIRASTQPMGTQ